MSVPDLYDSSTQDGPNDDDDSECFLVDCAQNPTFCEPEILSVCCVDGDPTACRDWEQGSEDDDDGECAQQTQLNEWGNLVRPEKLDGRGNFDTEAECDDALNAAKGDKWALVILVRKSGPLESCAR